MCGKAPPLANTPANGSQQATQLSPKAAPPAECRNRKSITEVKPSNKRGAHHATAKTTASVHGITVSMYRRYYQTTSKIAASTPPVIPAQHCHDLASDILSAKAIRSIYKPVELCPS